MVLYYSIMINLYVKELLQTTTPQEAIKEITEASHIPFHTGERVCPLVIIMANCSIVKTCTCFRKKEFAICSFQNSYSVKRYHIYLQDFK